jgi:hypothetical protein
MLVDWWTFSGSQPSVPVSHALVWYLATSAVVNCLLGAIRLLMSPAMPYELYSA